MTFILNNRLLHPNAPSQIDVNDVSGDLFCLHPKPRSRLQGHWKTSQSPAALLWRYTVNLSRSRTSASKSREKYNCDFCAETLEMFATSVTPRLSSGKVNFVVFSGNFGAVNVLLFHRRISVGHIAWQQTGRNKCPLCVSEGFSPELCVCVCVCVFPMNTGH